MQTQNSVEGFQHFLLFLDEHHSPFINLILGILAI